MSEPERILVIEIKTLENPGFDSSQLSTITLLGNPDNYQVALNCQLLRSAIVDAVLRLGSNYRHPLLFDVQILPDNETDTNPQPSNPRPNRRRRRKKTD